MADRPSAFARDPHVDHDLELVAAVVAGDAGGSDAERGAALIDSCVACRAVAADLQTIRVATRAMGSAFGAPQRGAPRDFRLTPTDAERLSRRGELGTPTRGRGRPWAARLGTGLVAVGLGVLVLSAAPINLLGGASGAAFGTQVNQQDSTAPLGPGQAGAPSSNLGAAATNAPERAVDSNAPSADRDGLRSLPLVPIGGIALVLGIAVLLASRAGRRAGP